jgi:hypothetical protein
MSVFSRERGASNQSIAQAIGDASDAALKLMHDEIELAKAEVGAKVASLLRGTAVGVAAGVFLLGAVQMALIGLALLAWYLLPVGQYEYFWGFFAVACALVLLAGLAALLAWRVVRSGSPPVPTMAIDEARKIREAVSGGEQQRPIPSWEPVGESEGVEAHSG